MALMYEVLGEKQSLDFEAIEKASAAARKKGKRGTIIAQPNNLSQQLLALEAKNPSFSKMPTSKVTISDGNTTSDATQ